MAVVPNRRNAREGANLPWSTSVLGVPDVRLVHQPEDLRGADKIILPGVGAFGAGMQKLQEQKLVQPVRDAVAQGIPYLGKPSRGGVSAFTGCSRLSCRFRSGWDAT